MSSSTFVAMHFSCSCSERKYERDLVKCIKSTVTCWFRNKTYMASLCLGNANKALATLTPHKQLAMSADHNNQFLVSVCQNAERHFPATEPTQLIRPHCGNSFRLYLVKSAALRQ